MPGTAEHPRRTSRHCGPSNMLIMRLLTDRDALSASDRCAGKDTGSPSGGSGGPFLAAGGQNRMANHGDDQGRLCLRLRLRVVHPFTLPENRVRASATALRDIVRCSFRQKLVRLRDRSLHGQHTKDIFGDFAGRFSAVVEGEVDEIPRPCPRLHSRQPGMPWGVAEREYRPHVPPSRPGPWRVEIAASRRPPAWFSNHRFPYSEIMARHGGKPRGRGNPRHRRRIPCLPACP